MNTLKKIWKKAYPVLKNKYVLTITAFLTVIVFFNQNSLLNRMENISKLNRLKADKIYYLEEIKKAEQKMYELMNNKEDLEKFAREEYLMKKPNEDIFIIVDGQESSSTN